MGIVDRLRKITRRHEVRKPVLPGAGEDVRGRQFFTQIDEARLFAEYVRDVQNISPDTSIEDAQRRISNLTHIHEIVAEIRGLARDNLPRS